MRLIFKLLAVPAMGVRRRARCFPMKPATSPVIAAPITSLIRVRPAKCARINNSFVETVRETRGGWTTLNCTLLRFGETAIE